ncbi:MAG: energy transducer TonB [Magnetococcales bacterium]|nr:energy transducer TonB [Magnetococcales bacterium]
MKMPCESDWNGDREWSGRRAWGAFGVALLIHGALAGALWVHSPRPTRGERTPVVFEMAFVSPPAPPVVSDALPPPETPPVEIPPAPPAPAPEPRPEVAPTPPRAPDPPRVKKIPKASLRSAPSPAPPREAEPQPLPVAVLPTPPVAASVPVPVPVVEEYRPVDVAAAYAANPKPDYPRSARRLGQAGSVLLSVELNAAGAVVRLRVQQGSGFEALDQAALEAVSRWRFLPARRNGQAVAATVTVPIRFALQSER